MVYEVSPDIREKEKIFGGILTLTQTVFLALGVLVGGGVVLLLFNSIGAIPAIILGVICGVPFLPFAFIKVQSMGDIELFQYCLIRLKYWRSQKEYVNVNDHYRDYLMGKEE